MREQRLRALDRSSRLIDHHRMHLAVVIRTGESARRAPWLIARRFPDNQELVADRRDLDCFDVPAKRSGRDLGVIAFEDAAVHIDDCAGHSRTDRPRYEIAVRGGGGAEAHRVTRVDHRDIAR